MSQDTDDTLDRLLGNKPEQEELLDPLDRILSGSGSPMAFGPNGPMQDVIGPEYVPPLPTPDNCVCLRDCKYLWTLIQAFPAGNTADSLPSDPKYRTRTCLANPHAPTEIPDVVYECSHWEPINPESPEEQRREAAREKYYQINSNHRPKKDG